MPGPRNQKARRKGQNKKTKRAKSETAPEPATSQTEIIETTPPPENDSLTHEVNEPLIPEAQPLQLNPPNTQLPRPLPEEPHVEPAATRDLPSIPSPFDSALEPASYPDDGEEVEPLAQPLFKRPFIEDPGSGIRVRDTREFLSSRFAAPPSLDDELCAEFAQDEVLQMLCSVLPDETALILWYNKSRLRARICPACQRLYRLGDVLHDPLGQTDLSMDPENEARVSENRFREQQISGLCSPVCFILAAFNYPAAIRSTWGRMAEDISDETWELLGIAPSVQSNDMGLGMLLKMTRCHDLGLGQLLFPDLDLDEEGPESNEGEEPYDDLDEAEDQSEESAEGYGEVMPVLSKVWQDGGMKEVMDGVGRLSVRVAAQDDIHDS
ncbi:hypothetical protein EUX98_g8260 [Antrodiella citrinella]|uniref:Uncharacterized protein n=1 Tax=Antrodiella citrinella TaxID=2447956 RepID=A0A4S4MAX4_9APHY|nr:hypothetical protein EUX98_g8260 [Antrodiella citrinella]